MNDGTLTCVSARSSGVQLFNDRGIKVFIPDTFLHYIALICSPRTSQLLDFTQNVGLYQKQFPGSWCGFVHIKVRLLCYCIVFPSMVWASTILQVVFTHVQVLVLFLQISRYPALPLGFLTFLCGTSLCRGLLDLFQCSMLTPPLHLALLVQNLQLQKQCQRPI